VCRSDQGVWSNPLFSTNAFAFAHYTQVKGTAIFVDDLHSLCGLVHFGAPPGSPHRQRSDSLTGGIYDVSGTPMVSGRRLWCCCLKFTLFLERNGVRMLLDWREHKKQRAGSEKQRQAVRNRTSSEKQKTAAGSEKQNQQWETETAAGSEEQKQRQAVRNSAQEVRIQRKWVGLARSIYKRCIYGICGRENTKYTVIYGVYIGFWPTLEMSHLGTSKDVQKPRSSFGRHLWMVKSVSGVHSHDIIGRCAFKIWACVTAATKLWAWVFDMTSISLSTNVFKQCVRSRAACLLVLVSKNWRGSPGDKKTFCSWNDVT